MSKSRLFKSIIGLTTIIAIMVGIVFVYNLSSVNKVLETKEDTDKIDLEALRQEMIRVAENEFKNGCVEKSDRGQDVFCGESKVKVDAAEARYKAALRESMKPGDAELQADIEGIMKFMGDKNFEVNFSRNQSPANFNVGLSTQLSDSGDEKIDTPEAWKRLVNVYTATKEVEGTCQVYEYEVYPKTHEVVEVRVVYPESQQACLKTGSLFLPQVSETEIKKVGEVYLNRISVGYIFSTTKLDRGETSRWEWKWQDMNYHLPQNFTGQSAVDSRPTIRLHISSAGKLLQYNNTAPLFD